MTEVAGRAAGRQMPAVWRPVSTLHRGHTGDTLATAGTPEQRSSRAPAPRAHTTLTVFIQQILLSVTPRQDVFILKSEDFPTRIESPLPYPRSKGPKKLFNLFSKNLLSNGKIFKNFETRRTVFCVDILSTSGSLSLIIGQVVWRWRVAIVVSSLVFHRPPSDSR